MDAAENAPKIESMRAVVDQLDDLTDQDEVTVRDIVTAFGDASFLPLMMVPALLVVSPLSGIPLFSSLCGLTIGLIGMQMLTRRDHVWLPGFVMRRKIGRRPAALGRRADAAGGGLDGCPRAAALAGVLPLPVAGGAAGAVRAVRLVDAVPRTAAVLVVLAWAAVCLMSLGFLLRDGLFMLGGFAFVSIAASIPFAVAGTLAG